MSQLNGKILPKTDLSGMKFGRLTAIKTTRQDRHYRIFYLCKCECGVEKEIDEQRLRYHQIDSCGCLTAEKLKAKITKHGESKIGGMTPEYVAYMNMKSRCYNPNYKNYKQWGGRGIRVCDRWLESYENFLQDMGRRPSSKHSLDRYPNNDGNYELNNCRWATELEQKRNRSSNKWIEYKGEKMIIKDWANKLGIDFGTCTK